jgi:hypothetical protein
MAAALWGAVAPGAIGFPVYLYLAFTNELGMERILECNLLKRSARNWQMVLAIPIGITGAYLLINMINANFGHRLFMPGWMVLVIFTFSLAVIAQILIWVLTKGKLVIDKINAEELEVTITFPTGEVFSERGRWNCFGQYSKTYAKYGTYNKNLALSLWCNDVPFCMLRHQTGGLSTEPNGFILVDSLINPGGTEYWCKKTYEVYRLLHKPIQQTKPV